MGQQVWAMSGKGSMIDEARNNAHEVMALSIYAQSMDIARSYSPSEPGL